MGFPGVWSHPEEDGGGDKARALKKTEAGTRPERLSHPQGTRLKKTEAGTRPERLSSTNMGVPGAWCHPEEDGGGDKARALILRGQDRRRRRRGQGRSAYPQPIWGCQVRGVTLKKTEAGTSPERLSSGDKTEEDGGGDKAGALILNQYGGARCVVSP